MTTPSGFAAVLPLAALLSGIALLPSPARAGSTQLLSRSDLVSGDVLAALPPIVTGNSIYVPGPYTLVTGDNSLTFTGSSTFDIQNGGDGLPPGSEKLYNIDSFTPDTITFAHGVDEFGFQGQGAYLAPFTFTYDVYDQSTLLGEYTASGVNNALPSDVAPFLGARATGGDEITSVVVSAITGGDPNNFSLGSVTYGPHATTPAVPEPTPLAFAVLGLPTLLLIAHRRARAV